MTLSEKIRYLREVEGGLRGLGGAMTQQEMVRAMAAEMKGRGISQSYLSQIESGARPHLTNTTRLLLAKFFKVHPGYLVDDPADFQAELRTTEIVEDKLDLWLIAGAESFGKRDPQLCRALLALAHHDDTRGVMLLMEKVLKSPGLVGRLDAVLAVSVAADAPVHAKATADSSATLRNDKQRGTTAKAEYRDSSLRSE